MNKICTVIVTYNRLELLKKAVDAIKHQTMESDILVINNGSTDGTHEWLDSQESLLIIQQENLGGAGGFYAGMKYACEKGYEFCWVMDDDVEPFPNALKSLYEMYKTQSKIEKIGFLCSTVVDPNGNLANVPTINERPSTNGYEEWNKYLEKGIVGVSGATFVSVFIPTQIIKEVGLPYKEFFIWGDDTEYTNRISMKYPCYLVGDSYVTHYRTEAIDLIKLKDNNRIRMYEYSVRNNWFNNKQGYYDKKKVLLNYLWHISIISRLLLKGEFRKTSVVLKGIFKGIFFKPVLEYPCIGTNK